PGRRYEGDQDSGRGTEGERSHGAADWFRSPRMPGLDPNHRPSTPGAGDAGVGGALQPSPTTSEPGPQNSDCQVGSGRHDRSCALPVTPWRAAARVLGRGGRGDCLIFVQTNMCASQAGFKKPLDLKLNYGQGEWYTYAFSPIILI